MSSAMRFVRSVVNSGIAALLLTSGCSWLDKRPTSAAKAAQPESALEKAKPAVPQVASDRAGPEAKPTGEPATAVPAVGSATAAPKPTVGPARKRLDAVAQRLAAAAADAGVKFQFDLVYNPRPRTYHFPDGHVYVSSGMLDELKSADDLAAVLALEMAQLLEEKKADQTTLVKTAAPPTGPDDDFRQHALAAKLKEQAVRPDDVRAGAQRILDKAGYRSANLASVRDRMQRFATRPETPTPRDPKLRQVFAN